MAFVCCTVVDFFEKAEKDRIETKRALFEFGKERGCCSRNHETMASTNFKPEQDVENLLLHLTKLLLEKESFKLTPI